MDTKSLESFAPPRVSRVRRGLASRQPKRLIHSFYNTVVRVHLWCIMVDAPHALIREQGRPGNTTCHHNYIGGFGGS